MKEKGGMKRYRKIERGGGLFSALEHEQAVAGKTMRKNLGWHGWFSEEDRWHLPIRDILGLFAKAFVGVLAACITAFGSRAQGKAQVACAVF